MPLGVIGTRNCFALRLLLACSAAALPWDPACYRRLTTYWQLMWSYPCTLATHRVFIAFHSPSAAKPSSHHACYSKPHTHSCTPWNNKSDNESVIKSLTQEAIFVCALLHVCLPLFLPRSEQSAWLLLLPANIFPSFSVHWFSDWMWSDQHQLSIEYVCKFLLLLFFFLTPKIAFDKGLLLVRWGEYSLLFQIYSNGLDCSVNKRALCVFSLGIYFPSSQDISRDHLSSVSVTGLYYGGQPNGVMSSYMYVFYLQVFVQIPTFVPYLWDQLSQSELLFMPNLKI